MRAKFLSNLFLLLILNLIVKPFWLLGVDREVQNVLGPEQYGTYFALLNFSILFSALLDFGVSAYNNRNIAQHQFLLSKYFPKLITIKLALAFLYTLVMLVLAFILGYKEDVIQLLLVLALNQVLISLILFLRSNLTALLLFKKDSVISVADKVLLILFCGGLLLYKDGVYLSIWSFILAQTVAYGLSALLAFLFLWGQMRLKRPSFNTQSYIAIIKESYPYAILVLLMALYSRTDALMLERLLPNGATQAGIYAQGYRILEAFSMIAYLFSTLLLPLFAKMLKQRSDVSDLVQSALKLLYVFSIGVSITCFLFSGLIINLLYEQDTQQSIEVFGFLIFSLIPIALTYIFGTLLTAGGKLRFLNQMAVGGVVLNLILNFILIPKYQASGAVVATLFTQGITAAVQLIMCFKYYPLKLEASLKWKLIVFPVLVVLIGLFVQSLEFHLWSVVLMLGGVLALGVIMGLLNPKAVVQLVKSRDK
ncbi:oligosaccharide flippase family protein [Luteibaculum oceani]|uniref:Oligosaccharide flippase family protein n=1 Tax=Luteibaculum oceani TaxID=1294296 RepID=A0A5C6UZM0_9FLAO|nr:oligosaccharide flippase family protein [Luteibaculum oceani]TXC78359.1 oligosaccharide flippase family protein [Luteibaculum oceani]